MVSALLFFQSRTFSHIFPLSWKDRTLCGQGKEEREGKKEGATRQQETHGPTARVTFDIIAQVTRTMPSRFHFFRAISWRQKNATRIVKFRNGFKFEHGFPLICFACAQADMEILIMEPTWPRCNLNIRPYFIWRAVSWNLSRSVNFPTRLFVKFCSDRIAKKNT